MAKRKLREIPPGWWLPWAFMGGLAFLVFAVSWLGVVKTVLAYMLMLAIFALIMVWEQG